MYRRLLAPLDGSELAERTLPYIRALARGLDAYVQVLRCYGPVAPDTVVLPDPTLPAKAAQAMRDEAQAYVERVVETLRQEGLSAIGEVREGAPAATIVALAAEGPQTLVVMSTHGRSSILRWTLGSVADKVVRSVMVPVLLYRPQDRAPPKCAPVLTTAIVPLDGSELAEQALGHAIPLARALGLRLVLLRASPPHPVLMEYAGHLYAGSPAEAEAVAARYLESTAKRLRAESALEVEAVTVRGDPASLIVDTAGAIKGSLVVMTSHGRSGIARWVLGSVADRMVRHGSFPTLVVRGA